MLTNTLKPFDRGKARTPEQAMKDVREYNPEAPAKVAIDDDSATDMSQYMLVELLEKESNDPTISDGKILVSKDWESEMDRKYLSLPLYQMIHFLERIKGKFVPDMRLTCRILEAMFNNRADPEHEKLLQEYNPADNFGRHGQNTIVNYRQSSIIHYPHDADFTRFGGEENVNIEQATMVFPFIKNNLQGGNLERALKNPDVMTFMKDLTGLHELEVLVEIGKYFKKPARLNFPKDVANYTSMCAVEIGCGQKHFNITVNAYPGRNTYTRGVKTPE